MDDAIRGNLGFIFLFVLGVLHLLKVVTFDWPVIVVFLVALLPSISRLVDSFKAGKDGLEFKTRAGSKPAEEVEKAPKSSSHAAQPPAHQPAVASPGGVQVPPASDFAILSDDQKMVLKALWHFQKTTFGINSPTRWGFTVGPGSPDYYRFLSGTGLLLAKDLITIGDKGMGFLTSKGIDFCQSHEDEIDKYPPYYQKFRSA